MGLDKMNKDAVYDSLIDASKIVSRRRAEILKVLLDQVIYKTELYKQYQDN